MTPPETPPGRHHLGGGRSLGFVVLSVSDTHTEEDDPSGHLACDLMTAGGHRLVRYRLVANSVADVRDALDPYLEDRAVEALITVGGTGVSSRDLTVNALEAMGGRLLPGFGEVYRSTSLAEVGPLATLSRAGLYLVKLKPIFALPGSERAVRTGIERLILPSVQHLVEELER
ncbi:MAG: molybdopterin-binding protein [Thermoplasmata archaeon]|nr:molybdopterin-binding protein [Thermoplasmata archaeon]MCI4358950.1 molybdopterin-binding protein [Thermoplasmata archaeon]